MIVRTKLQKCLKSVKSKILFETKQDEVILTKWVPCQAVKNEDNQTDLKAANCIQRVDYTSKTFNAKTAKNSPNVFQIVGLTLKAEFDHQILKIK